MTKYIFLAFYLRYESEPSSFQRCNSFNWDSNQGQLICKSWKPHLQFRPLLYSALLSTILYNTVQFTITMYNIFDIVPCNMAYNTVLYLYYIVHDINCTITHYCTQYCTYICVISKYYIVHNINLNIS
jgi:hypothetical protein